MTANLRAANRTVAEQTYDTLKGDLLSGVFAPGSALLTRELLARYGCGISPLREAISRLVGEGMLAAIRPSRRARAAAFGQRPRRTLSDPNAARMRCAEACDGARRRPVGGADRRGLLPPRTRRPAAGGHGARRDRDRMGEAPSRVSRDTDRGGRRATAPAHDRAACRSDRALPRHPAHQGGQHNTCARRVGGASRARRYCRRPRSPARSTCWRSISIARAPSWRWCWSAPRDPRSAA